MLLIDFLSVPDNRRESGILDEEGCLLLLSTVIKDLATSILNSNLNIRPYFAVEYFPIFNPLIFFSLLRMRNDNYLSLLLWMYPFDARFAKIILS